MPCWRNENDEVGIHRPCAVVLTRWLTVVSLRWTYEISGRRGNRKESAGSDLGTRQFGSREWGYGDRYASGAARDIVQGALALSGQTLRRDWLKSSTDQRNTQPQAAPQTDCPSL